MLHSPHFAGDPSDLHRQAAVGVLDAVVSRQMACHKYVTRSAALLMPLLFSLLNRYICLGVDRHISVEHQSLGNAIQGSIPTLNMLVDHD